MQPRLFMMGRLRLFLVASFLWSLSPCTLRYWGSCTDHIDAMINPG
jgi:hypothetical protein